MQVDGESTSGRLSAANPANDDLTCPLCGYSLRGLIDPRCPECGHVFDWETLRDNKLRVHPYLIEHHGLRSFFKTVRRSQFAGKFWRTLQPLHQCVPGRLMLYWFLVLFTPLLAVALEITEVQIPRPPATVTAPYWSFTANYTPPRGHPFVVDELSQDQYLPPLLYLAGLGLLWPWLTLGPLFIYRQSMRKARVKPEHLLRCVIYSGDVIFWAGLLAAALVTVTFAFDLQIDATPALRAILVVAYLLACCRLIRAYQLYLHFPHAAGVIIAAQIISLLLIPTILALIGDAMMLVTEP